jgi:hypothetical protein
VCGRCSSRPSVIAPDIVDRALLRDEQNVSYHVREIHPLCDRLAQLEQLDAIADEQQQTQGRTLMGEYQVTLMLA